MWPFLTSTSMAADAPVDSADPPYRIHVLSQDGTETYTLRSAGSSVEIVGPAEDTMPGSNTRILFWNPATEQSIDQQTCATWVSQTANFDQQGGALRVHSVSGHTRAILVTRNVFGHAWIFNVHLWDSALPGIPAMHAQFDMQNTLLDPATRSLRALPWRLCARVRGTRLDFKVWPLSSNEPEWTAQHLTGSTTLPQEWVRAGWAGWYAGHLAQGHVIHYDNLLAEEL